MSWARWGLIATLLMSFAGTAGADPPTSVVDPPALPKRKQVDAETAKDASVAALEEAAANGIVGAMVELAERYAWDREVRPDPVKRADWYRRAMEGGSVASMYKLGELYALGEGVPRDPAEGRRLQQRAYSLVMAGEGRDLFASDLPGIEMQPETGAPPSVLAAIPPHRPDPKLLLADAEAGNAEAMYRLAELYEFGDPFWDVTASRDRAEAWAEKASDAGHVGATMKLAYWRLSGFPVRRSGSISHGPQDLEAAAAFFLKAAEAGNPRAMKELAYMYFAGRGVPLDRPLGERWLRQAADAGDTDAMIDLAMNLKGNTNVAANWPESVAIWKRLADISETRSLAMFALQMIYTTGGPGVPADPAEAVYWRKRAEALLPESKARDAARSAAVWNEVQAKAAARAKLWEAP